MSIPREVFEKYAVEYQTTIVSSSKQLSQARAALQNNVKTQRVSALTLRELEPLSLDAPVYRSVGKAFLQDSLDSIRQELQQKQSDCVKQTKPLEAAVTKFERELSDAQKSLQELIKKVSAPAS